MKINKDFGMVMIDLSAKEVSMLLELIDLAIDTRQVWNQVQIPLQTLHTYLKN